MICLLGGWSGRLYNRLDSSIAISCTSRGWGGGGGWDRKTTLSLNHHGV